MSTPIGPPDCRLQTLHGPSPLLEALEKERARAGPYADKISIFGVRGRKHGSREHSLGRRHNDNFEAPLPTVVGNVAPVGDFASGGRVQEELRAQA